MKTVSLLSLALFALLAVTAAVARVQLSFAEEWQMWKSQHGKSYGSEREELERHLVWRANREYINGHNQNAHIFGFTLAMNHLGDIVSVIGKSLYTACYLYSTLLVRVYISNLYCAVYNFTRLMLSMRRCT